GGGCSAEQARGARATAGGGSSGGTAATSTAWRGGRATFSRVGLPGSPGEGPVWRSIRLSQSGAGQYADLARGSVLISKSTGRFDRPSAHEAPRGRRRGRMERDPNCEDRVYNAMAGEA